MSRRKNAPEAPALASQSTGSHGLHLAHAFGIYPTAIRDSVISLGDDAFAFCIGRHITICDHVRHRQSFLPRDSKNRIITAVAKSQNGKFLAVAERLGSEEGSAQVCILNAPKTDGFHDLSTSKAAEAKDTIIKCMHPANRRVDIVGLAFTADAKFLVSLSAPPDTTVTYWRWEIASAVASHDIKLPVTRLQVNPKNGNELSISGPSYLRLWEYNPNDHHLKEHPSMFSLKQEKQMHVVDHCWVLLKFLAAATEDGHVHLFEEGEHQQKVDVRSIIAKDEAGGQKAVEREQAKLLQNVLGSGGPGRGGEMPPVKLTSLAPWGGGFVVGGDQGYLGIFKMDAKMQIEPFGTFRIPGEEAKVWQMASSAEDTHLMILSYTEREPEGPAERVGMPKAMRVTAGSGFGAAGGDPAPPTEMDRMWSLSTFPVGQADLAATGQLEVFAPVYELGVHHGPISAMSASANRRVVATCGHDKELKVWGYPGEDTRGQPHAFTSELSIHVAVYETPTALALHPLGFQVAVVLEDMLRIYHLTSQQVTRTLFDVSLKHPGDVAYSNGGNMLAVTSENDVILFDPWRSVLIHMFSGRGGHLSTVNQVLFSEDDRLLMSCSAAPHGAIYGWDLESETKERSLEHVSKGTSFACIAHDFRRQLLITCTRPEGNLRVISHGESTHLDVPSEGRGCGYTTLCLAAPLGMLFAGTQQGSVRIFHWPLAAGGAAANPFTEVPLHAHSITALALSCNAGLLFSTCEGGAVMTCEVGTGVPDRGESSHLTSVLLDQSFVRFRHKEDGALQRKPNREEDRRIHEVQKKLLESRQGLSVNTATLDKLVMVPKVYLSERLGEIKELEEQMQRLRDDNERQMEQRHHEMQEKIQNDQHEFRFKLQASDEKYDNLFMQFKRANDRHQEELKQANGQFDQRTRELQGQFDNGISKEYDKQSRLLHELQGLREQHEVEMKQVNDAHAAQLAEMKNTHEKALRDWRADYDRVCNLLKADGLKFEEALRQQESEYEGQISEIVEHKRRALQVESEKSTTALKDGVSMKQTISMLQRQMLAKDDELAEAARERDDLRRKLEAQQDMFAKVKDKLKECERGLQVKDESLTKIRGEVKHLESYRFVLFHKVCAMQEERDPLEEQKNSLKANVREMYGEFVREFKQKQKLDQQLSKNVSLSTALQNENVELRAQLSQLKKEGRRFLQDVESVLHAQTTSEFESMPRRLQEVIGKYQKLHQWQPSAAPAAAGGEGREQHADVDGSSVTQETSLIEELMIQRDLFIRKNQIATAAASQSKRECSQNVGRLTSENAHLIAEMNRLRDENRSYQRSCKELSADVTALKAKDVARTREMKGMMRREVHGDHSEGLHRAESAPDLDMAGGGESHGTHRRVRPPAGGGGTETPYMRRKIVDQQEMTRRQQQRQLNRLPPAGQPGTPTTVEGPGAPGASFRARPTAQEKRFTQSLESVQADRRQMEQQGFGVGKLRGEAKAKHAATTSPDHPPAAPLGSSSEGDGLDSFPSGDGA